jgi:hypothetical protein
MLITVGAGSACAAVLTASRKPSSVLGAKYTVKSAFGASAPATSMSRNTSPSAPLGSLPGSFLASSTLTAVTFGVVRSRPLKYVSRSSLE